MIIKYSQAEIGKIVELDEYEKKELEDKLADTAEETPIKKKAAEKPSWLKE